jgi:outer membrane protein
VHHLIRLSLALGALVLGPATVAAQPRGETTGFSYGLAFVANDSPYADGGWEFTGLPLLNYRGEGWSIGLLDGLRYAVIDDTDLTLQLVLAPRIYQTIVDNSGDPLDGVDRTPSGEAGIEAKFQLSDFTQVNLRAVQEVTGVNGGSEVVLELRQTFIAGFLPVYVGGGVTWQSGDLARYAWGVFPDEATATRPAYAPGDVLIPNLAVGTFIPLGDKTSVIGALRVDLLPAAVIDSPIVGRDRTTSVFIGVTRSF